MADAVEKRFFRSGRARLIQDQTRMRNLDSKIHSVRFYCCVFVFYSLYAVQSADETVLSTDCYYFA
jgi:hypothetical protein